MNNKINPVFDDVIGYESQKLDLSRYIDILNHQDKYEKLGVKIPHSIILIGSPGLGKTMMATKMLEAVNRPNFILRKDSPKDDVVNKINDVFEQATALESAILVIDDVDKFSNNDGDHPNSEEFVAIQTWIDRVKDKNIFVIFTANEKDAIPDSLLRRGRVDKEISFRVPSREDTEKIIRFYLQKTKIGSDIDYKEITGLFENMSCVEIASYINEAGLYAGFKNKKAIDMEDIMDVYLHSIREIPEVIDKDKERYDEEASYFNAGGIVVQELLEPDSVCFATILNNYNGLDGRNIYFQDKDYWKDKKYMENRVMMLLSSRASYELKYGRCDIDSDLYIDRAFNIVSRFVNIYGCSGLNFMNIPYVSASQELKEEREIAIASEICKYYERVKEMLINHRDLLDKVAKALQEKKILRRKDIQALMAA